MGMRRQRRMIREQVEEGKGEGGYERVVVSQGGALVFMQPQGGDYESDLDPFPSFSTDSGDPEGTFLQLVTLAVIISLLLIMTCTLCMCMVGVVVVKLKIHQLFTTDQE
ncbi:uncharacterized protein LOC134848866 [Symsagittifera roscoffensis]|uniref:uncharacterized protein LOC134848866 n=1 Tax=Symsagittifera roscoffensis TaxID=84072 RepID=UPI00307B5320